MGYDSDTRERIRSFNPWREIASGTDEILGRVLGLDETRRQCEDTAAAVLASAKELTRLVKLTNDAVGDLILTFESHANAKVSAKKILSDFQKINKIPAECLDLIEKHGDTPISVSFDDIIKDLKDYISWFTEDIALLKLATTDTERSVATVKKIWAHVCTGTNLPSLEIFEETYYLKVREYIENFKGKFDSQDSEPRKSSKPEQAWGSDEEEWESPPTEATGGYGKPSGNSYAAKTRNKDKGPSLKKQWGDYTSSEDEDDDISRIFGSFGTTGVESKPHIEIPRDFDERFPSIAKGWRKICKKWQWEVRVSDCSFHSEGYIGKNFGAASDDQRVEILADMVDQERIAFNTFVTLLASVLYKPESIKNVEQGNLVSGFVTSMFLLDHYKNSDSDMKLLRVSLKGADAGEGLINARVYQCFKTGSKSAKTLLTSVNKMLRRLVAKASKEDKDSVLDNADLCFTSYQGMMHNSFHNVQKKVVETKIEIQKNGKQKKTRVSVNRPGKDRPHLNAKDLELTTDERAKVRAKESSFNKLDEVVAEVLEKTQTSKDPLRTAKVVKGVVDLAYDKINEIRRCNKERRNAIRAKAQELAGEGKSVQSDHWLKARKEIVASYEAIEDSVLKSLEWDADVIVKDLGL
jgi:hypothetical protein